MADMNPISPIKGPIIAEVPQIKNAPPTPSIGKDQPSFTDVLSSVFNDVNQMQHNADQSVQKLATGEITDVHQVMVAMNEADVAFKLMMEIRNKLISAYREIIKTPV